MQESIAAVFTKLLTVLRTDHKQLGLQALEIIVD